MAVIECIELNWIGMKVEIRNYESEISRRDLGILPLRGRPVGRGNLRPSSCLPNTFSYNSGHQCRPYFLAFSMVVSITLFESGA